MPKLYLLLAAAGLAATTARAQTAPSIVLADMPVIGDSLRLSQAVALPATAPALTLNGVNKTWNYAGLVATSQRVERYNNVSTATGLALQFTFNNQFLNPNNKANLVSPGGLPAGTGTGTPLPITDPMEFFNSTAADFRSVGYGGTLAGTAVPVTYASKPQQDIIYTFPLTYGSAQAVSNSLLTTPAAVASTGYFSQKRQRTTVVDGWGTITTPFGTFQAIRVVATLNDHDSLAIGGAAGQGLTLPTRKQYLWLAKTIHVPVLAITTTQVGTTEQVSAVEYRDIYRRFNVLGTSVAAQAAGFACYPSPSVAGEALRLTVPAGAGPLTVTGRDVVGRQLFRQSFAAGSGEVTLEAASLGAYRGLLLLTVQTSQGTATLRTVCQ